MEWEGMERKIEKNGMGENGKEDDEMEENGKRGGKIVWKEIRNNES